MIPDWNRDNESISVKSAPRNALPPLWGTISSSPAAHQDTTGKETLNRKTDSDRRRHELVWVCTARL